MHDDQLHEELLFDEDFVLAVPAEHALAHDDGPVSMGVLAGESVLLLEDGHCLRDQALSVCQLSGASERSGFRATSLETLRQMVAAGVGMTLLPELAVQSPVAASPGVAIRRFEEPRPTTTDRDVLASQPSGPVVLPRDRVVVPRSARGPGRAARLSLRAAAKCRLR